MIQFALQVGLIMQSASALAVKDPIENILMVRTPSEMLSVTLSIARRDKSKLSDKEVAAAFFGCLVLAGSQRKKMLNLDLNELIGHLNTLSQHEFTNPEAKLCQGWWLVTCAPQYRMRMDQPDRWATIPVTENGQKKYIKVAVYESKDPAIDRGNQMLKKAVRTAPDSPLIRFYQLRKNPNSKITGSKGIRASFEEFREPWKWVFLRELVMRDAASSDAEILKKKWLFIAGNKDRSFFLQYLTAPDPKQ